MIQADNAIICGMDGENRVKFIPKCPLCGKTDNTWAPIGTSASVNPKGRTFHNQRCPHCGKYYKITFYGF